MSLSFLVITSNTMCTVQEKWLEQFLIFEIYGSVFDFTFQKLTFYSKYPFREIV